MISRFELNFGDPRYHGRKESLTIRGDRVVLDMNLERLKQEFGEEFKW